MTAQRTVSLPPDPAMIDSHHHLWDLSAVCYPWLMAKGKLRFFGDPTAIQRDYLVDEFREEASASGFTASVHIQVGAADPLAEARWVQTIAIANPGWPAAQVAFCDLAGPDAESQLAELTSLSTVRGVRQIVGRSHAEDAKSGVNQLLADPDFKAGLQLASSLGLSFDLQLTPHLLRPAAELLTGIPDLKVALCHAGSPSDQSRQGLADWENGLACLSELPNTVCKLSGLGMFFHGWKADEFRPVVEACLSRFGPERCMFGSNFPVDKLQSGYARNASAYSRIVPRQWHDAVFRSTAERFYRI